MAQIVKCLPTMQETWVQPLGWEDLLEKEMATHSSILAWEILRREEPGGGLHSMESQRDRTYQLNSNNNMNEITSVRSDSLQPHGLYMGFSRQE